MRDHTVYGWGSSLQLSLLLLLLASKQRYIGHIYNFKGTLSGLFKSCHFKINLHFVDDDSLLYPIKCEFHPRVGQGCLAVFARHLKITNKKLHL